MFSPCSGERYQAGKHCETGILGRIKHCNGDYMKLGGVARTLMSRACSTPHPPAFLVKSEPDDFSLGDLRRKDSEIWTGVRNPVARNHLRKMQIGDRVIFYHSSCKDIGCVGTAVVTKAAYPDETQFVPTSKYYDPKSTRDKPKWDVVDLAYESTFKRTVSLKELKELKTGGGHPALDDFALLKQSRLSVMPVSDEVWDLIVRLGHDDQGPPSRPPKSSSSSSSSSSLSTPPRPKKKVKTEEEEEETA